MKIFEILDYENMDFVGILLYYEKKEEFIIELADGLDEWTAPLLFTALVKKGIHTVPRDLSRLWVQERIIPSGRQNIGEILKTHKLASYDEMKLLELSDGRCSQDCLYVRKTGILPAFVQSRREKNVTECIPCDNHELLCFFSDDTIKKIRLAEHKEIDGVSKITKTEALFQSCMPGTDGYYITFNDSIDIPSAILYDIGEPVPLSRNDFLAFVQKNILDTSECCSLLECSRQNLAYLTRKKKLSPVKEAVRGNLYLKGEILTNTW